MPVIRENYRKLGIIAEVLTDEPFESADELSYPQGGCAS
jgi:hypothetical protein